MTLKPVKSCLFSRGCFFYPPFLLFRQGQHLFCFPYGLASPRASTHCSISSTGGEEASHSSPGLGTPAPNNALSSFPSVTKGAGDCLKDVQPMHKLFLTS